MYTADHGDFLGSHRLDNKGPAMYEEITRIPMLVQWPGPAPCAIIRHRTSTWFPR
jgi:choline-sulfatase